MAGRANAGVSKLVTLIITSVASFSTSYIYSSINVALPAIGKEFAMEAVWLGWVANASILATAATLIPTGRLADIYGRRKIFLFGMLLFIVSSFLCGISNSAILLVIYRVLQGLSAGMMIGVSMAILTSVYPAEERGRAIGVLAATVYTGLAVGPFLGGVLTQHLGWRSVFFVGAFMCLVVLVMTFWRLRGEWAEAKGEGFDIVGAMAFIISMALVMYGFTLVPVLLGIGLVVVGLLGLMTFVRWEAKVASPILNVGLFRKNAVFVFSNLATLISYISTYAVIFLMSLYLQYNKGLSPQTAGLILLAQPVLVVIFSPIGGRLSDRIEPRLVASAGLVLNCVALLLFVFLTDKSDLWFIIAGLVICGIGIGLFVSPNGNAVMGSVEKKYFGVASGAQATMRNTGMVLSIGIAMILFSIFIGDVQITPEYYPAFLRSLQVGFIIFTALSFGGIFVQLAGRRAKTVVNV